MKYILIIVFISLYSALIVTCQTLDSSFYFGIKKLDATAQLHHEKKYFGNGNLMYEGWCQIIPLNPFDYPDIDLRNFDSADIQIGLWKYYYKDEILRVTSNYSISGKDTSYEKGFDKKGKIKYENKYIMKQPLPVDKHGSYNKIAAGINEFEYFTFKKYFQGVIILLGSFSSGKKNGEWKWFDQKGTLKKTFVYHNGLIISRIKN